MTIRANLLADATAIYTGEDQHPTQLTDVSGNAHHGVVDASAVWTLETDYLSRYCLTGDGENTAAIVTSASWLDTWQAGPAAAAVWFRPGVLSGRRLWQLIPGGNTGIYYTKITTGFQRIEPLCYWRVLGSPLISNVDDAGTTQWRHYGLQRDSENNVSLYVNGSLAGTVSGGESYSGADLNFLGPTPFSDGSFAEFGMWSRVLTDAEWMWLANPKHTLSSLTIGEGGNIIIIED